MSDVKRYNIVHQIKMPNGKVFETIIDTDHGNMFYSREFAQVVLDNKIPKKIPANQKYFVKEI